MSITTVPDKVRYRLWGKAGGRCQYDGCNDRLWLDTLTQVEFNAAYIAHIIADSPEGPRGHPVLSDQFKADISNLMLMCDRHHRLIDREQIEEHTAERLQKMKRDHEHRIELLGSLGPDKQSHVLLYGANIGYQSAALSLKKAAFAMLPEWYPAESAPIEISLRNSSIRDHDQQYWQWEKEHLDRIFSEQVRPRLSQGSVHHLSVFALAPQPLLVRLGALLSDIPAAEIYQLHREPPDWKWQEPPSDSSFKLERPLRKAGPPAILLSLSATVSDPRVESVISDPTIWRIRIDVPNNDFLKSREQSRSFRVLMRHAFDEIKAMHGQDEKIHVFPAMPVALAVELGRVWMPKADLPLIVYDENKSLGGFQQALMIGNA